MPDQDIIAAAEDRLDNSAIIAAAEDRLRFESGESIFDEEVVKNPFLDKETGAPKDMRSYVGLIAAPQDRLAAVRQRFPDAQAINNAENFIYTNPDTGKPTLFNPEGLDVGDIAGISREGIQMLTGGLGAFLGGAAGAELGPPGILGGAVLGGGTGEAAGGEISTRLATLLGAPDTRTSQEIKLQMGMDFLFGAGGEMAAPLIGMGLRGGARATIRGTGAMREAAQRRMEAFTSAGIFPTPGQLGKRSVLESFEGFLARFPGASGRIAKVAQKAQDSLQARLTDISERLYSAADSELAGEAITGGIQNIHIPRIRRAAGRLYGRLDDLVPEATPVSLDNFVSTVQDFGKPIEGAESISSILTSPVMQKLTNAIGQDLAAGNGKVPFSALQQLRTFVGNKLTNVSLVDDFSRAELKQIYGALSQDILAAAEESAGKQGVDAFNRANSFWKNQTKALDNFLDPLLKRGEKGGGVARVFKAFEQSGRDGPATIRAVKNSVGPDQWRLVQALSIRRLGLMRRGIQDVEEVSGTFSSRSFLKNWYDLPKSTKDELFGGRAIRKDLDKIAEVSRSLEEAGPEFSSPTTSRGTISGGNIFLGAAGAIPAAAMMGQSEAAVAGIVGLGSAVGGLNFMTKLWTSPTFVKWLSKSTELAPSGYAAHMTRAYTLAERADPVTRDAWLAYLGQFAQQNEQ